MVEIKGIIPAMATPFNEDESINEQELRNSIDRHINAGVNGVFCLGTNGENYAMTFEEKVRVMEITVDHTAKRVPVYAGTGCVTTKETVELTKKAQQVGADVCSVISPWFAENSQDGLYAHYKAVAGAVDIPIVVYNMPARTGVNVDYKTMAKMAQIDNIMGAKDSSGNFDNMLRYIEETEDFAVFSGNDSLILWNLYAGGVGGITGIANLFPEVMVAIYQNWLKGDFEEAKRVQDCIRPLRDCLKMANPNSIVKRMAYLLGYNLGPARAPFNLQNDKLDETLKKVLDEFKANNNIA